MDDLKALQGREGTLPVGPRRAHHAQGGGTHGEESLQRSDREGAGRSGLASATGGSGAFACSGDMLLERWRHAPASRCCGGDSIGVNLRAVRSMPKETWIFGERLEFPRCAGGLPTHAAGIHARYRCSAEQLRTLLRLTERYCVVYQTLRQPALIEVSLNGQPASESRP